VIEHLTFVSLLAKQFENRSPKTNSSCREDRGTDIKYQFPPTISLAFPKISLNSSFQRATRNLPRKGAEIRNCPCRVRDPRRKKIMELHIVSTCNRIAAGACTCARASAPHVSPYIFAPVKKRERTRREQFFLNF